MKRPIKVQYAKIYLELGTDHKPPKQLWIEFIDGKVTVQRVSRKGVKNAR